MPSTTGGGNWLAVVPPSGVLPGINPGEWETISISVASSSLAAGVYYGTITITAAGDAQALPADNTPQVIQVALTVGNGGTIAPGISVSPSFLAFNAAAGAGGAALNVQVANIGGGTLNWSAAAVTAGGGNWLSAAPASGVNAGSFVATAGAGTLGPGAYTGQIVVTAPGAANSPQSIPVTFQVRAPSAPILQLNATTLSFSATANGSSPLPQNLEVHNGGDGLLNWQAQTATFNGGSWLTVTPASGSAPQGVAISVDSSGLPLGTYAGRINFTSDGAQNSPLQVPVTLTVGRPQPVFDSRGVVNAATFLPSLLSPGQIVTVFGSHLGPRDKAAFTLDPATNKIPTALAGTAVTFDGIPAPLFFVSEGQVNLQVPFELAGKSFARMIVTVDGLDPAETALPVADAAPGVFTTDGTHAAALNQDFTLNGPANPAAVGSVIQMFLTGQGALDPPVATGALAPATPPFPAPVLPVKVTVGGLDAPVLFAGAAPGFAGLTQLNVQIPPGLQPSSEVGVWVLVGSNPAGKRVTIAVR